MNPFVSGVCNFLGSVSSQQKFEVTDVKALCVSQLSDRSVLQLRVTAQFYLENKGKYILKTWGHANPKDARIRERAPALWLLFLHVFIPSPVGLLYVNWASQVCCLFYLRSSLWSPDLPLFYFWGLFPVLSFSHCQSGLLFPILTTWQAVFNICCSCICQSLSFVLCPHFSWCLWVSLRIPL